MAIVAPFQLKDISSDGESIAFAETFDSLASAWLPTVNYTVFSSVPAGTYEVRIKGGVSTSYVAFYLTYPGDTITGHLHSFINAVSQFNETILYITLTSSGSVLLRAATTSSILRPTVTMRSLHK